MPTMKSLHVGLNAVDPKSYGAPYELLACEADAADMRALAEARGAEAAVILTADATCDAVLQAMQDAADELVAGDMFFITYSGHGGQVPDVDGEEPDFLDETWCLFDSQLRDDDINAALASFTEGVQILVLSDSCHSGTVSRGIAMSRDANLVDSGPAKSKRLPLTSTVREFESHEGRYHGRATAPKSAVRATGALISGCLDDQESKDGAVNGAFTGALLRVWDDGAFSGDHSQLHQAIKQNLREGGFEQEPNLRTLSVEDDAYRAFLALRPLTL
ncbi:caspase family protein [Agromyces bracchium]|uniref:Caspase family protein n=1 Tax=Agromyces bracchium TaxID=88376 RepID=A0A6I3M9D5_9MICO|nr:caspase family protein [Agromyces bracchium]MTH69825.1 caspase family protein [Agromyces bracchium]